jgi:hypothetical protein
VGTDAARGLSLGLTGADRLANPDGSPRAPLSVVRGNRTFLVYEIAPTLKEPVVVSVASEDGWHLAAVLGSAGSASVAADLLVARGLDAIVKPVLPGNGGSRTLSWVEAPPPPLKPPPDKPPGPGTPPPEKPPGPGWPPAGLRPPGRPAKKKPSKERDRRDKPGRKTTGNRNPTRSTRTKRRKPPSKTRRTRRPGGH